MTVSTITRPAIYDADGQSVEFVIPWIVSDPAWVRAGVSDGERFIEMQRGADFAVNGDADAGYVVRFAAPPAAGDSRVAIWRATPPTQQVSFRDLRRLPAENIEFAADRLTEALQDVASSVESALQTAPTDRGRFSFIPSFSGDETQIMTFRRDPAATGRVLIEFGASVEGVEEVRPFLPQIEALGERAGLLDALGAPGVLADIDAVSEPIVIDRITALGAAESLDAMAAIKADFDLGPQGSAILNAGANAAAAGQSADAAATSAEAAAMSAVDAAGDAGDAELAAARAAGSEYAAIIRFLPGVYASATEAAAVPGAAIGSRYTGSDDGDYTLLSLDPPEARLNNSALSTDQSANLSSIPALEALANANADAIGRMVSGAASTGSGGSYAVASLGGRPAESLTRGLIVIFIANHTNTGAATLNLDTLGARAVRKWGGGALRGGDIQGGAAVAVIYDGASWQLIGPTSNPSLRALADFSGVANQVPMFSAADQLVALATSSFGRSWLNLSGASAGRSALGLGSLAILNQVAPANFNGVLPTNKGGTGSTSLTALRSAMNVLWTNSQNLDPSGFWRFSNGITLNWGRRSFLGTRYTTVNLPRSVTNWQYTFLEGGVVTNDRFPNPPFVTQNLTNSFTAYNPIGQSVICSFLSIGV